MSIYLKQFETQAAYEAAESGLILPNVSLIADSNAIHYKSNNSTPTPTPTPTHDYVEIGGLKWATMNIGANSVTDAGLYFLWGDTQGYTASQVGSGEGLKYFDGYWSDYKWTEDGGNTFTKYTCTGSSSSGSGSGSGSGSDSDSDFECDGLCELLSLDDAVTAAWGGSWRMPTAAEYAALAQAVNIELTSDYQGSGVAGLVCTDKTDSSKVLFFPASGHCYYGSVDNPGNNGFYWSSSVNNDSVQYANCFIFVDDTLYSLDNSLRYYGCPVRGVTN